MSLIFSLKQVSKTYGDDTLFHDLTIDFKLNEKLGLVGMNGSGKSTLLRLTAGLSDPDEGDVIRMAGLKIVYLSQEDDLNPDLSVEQTLYQTLKTERVDDRDIHKRVQKALGQGGFPDTQTPARNLSGGWKKKLAITRALCCEPDVLLLDEPTNHLDINGILWLEDILRTASFSFVLVSHDRAFLENTCSHVMEIARYYPSGYFKVTGRYDTFEKERKKFLIAQEKQQLSLASKMRRETEWLRQGAKARTTKAKYRIEQAYELNRELSAVRKRNQTTASLDIDFHATGRQTKKLLRCSGVSKQMGQQVLFQNISFELGPGQCLGIVGQNGSGKSTLLSILEQTIEPDQGKIQWAQNLQLAVFDQTRSALDPESTLKDALNPAGGDSVLFKDKPIHIVTWAKRFLFMPDQLEMPVKRLSGGEKARIMLARIMLTPCDVLLLDEPTNDLDILSLEVLEDSIKSFPGAVVIVTHDRYLLDRVCQRVLYLDPGKEALFFRNFDQILSHRTSDPEKSAAPKEEKPKKVRTALAFSFKDKFELDHIEEKILEAEKEAETLTQKLQLPEIMADAEEMSLLCTRLETAQKHVQELYDRWEHLEEKKAAAQKD